jgi:uncharacterized protein with FMN-binding domain
LLALVGFSVAVTVLIGLKTPSTARLLGWSTEAGSEPIDAVGVVPAGEGGDNALSSDPSGAPAASMPGANPGPLASNSPGSTPTTPVPGTSTTSSAPPAASQTYTGMAVAIKTATSPNAPRSGCGSCHTYSITVTITVTGGRVTAATAAYSPQPSGESLQLANKANNTLRASVLTQQSWNLGRVSGATYSANAWELSVKDAMSKAGLPV